MAIRAHWRPNPIDATEHHYGIPARNLTDEDWAGLDKDQRETVRGSKLYRYVTKEPRRLRTHPFAADPPKDEPAEPDDPPKDEPAATADEGETS